jgi:CheY-like chemotaxis protein
MVDNRGVPPPSGISETAPESTRVPRVVLADDDVLLREGLASLLNHSGFDVVGQVGNETELLALVRSAQPELAIIDIRMPTAHTTEGLHAARVIHQELPDTAIILLSAHVELNEAMDLLAGGERVGYLLKNRVTDVTRFIETVERITAGVAQPEVPDGAPGGVAPHSDRFEGERGHEGQQPPFSGFTDEVSPVCQSPRLSHHSAHNRLHPWSGWLATTPGAG